MRSQPGHCANPDNPHSPTPALRALLIALDQWASSGKAPPPSRTPRIADGTLIVPAELKFPAIPGVAVARRVNTIGVLTDWVKPQMDVTKPYRTLVTRVDTDGNETSGILLPDIAIPLGTYTGWNLYKSPFPEGELCDRTGSFMPFAITRAERTARGDPRPSLMERYGDHAGYVRKVEEAVQGLLNERLLLPEDGEQFVARARSKETSRLFTAAP
jgi:hypothetical protein